MAYNEKDTLYYIALFFPFFLSTITLWCCVRFKMSMHTLYTLNKSQLNSFKVKVICIVTQGATFNIEWFMETSNVISKSIYISKWKDKEYLNMQ